MVDGGPLTGWLKEGTWTGKQAQRELGFPTGVHGGAASSRPLPLPEPGRSHSGRFM